MAAIGTGLSCGLRVEERKTLRSRDISTAAAPVSTMPAHSCTDSTTRAMQRSASTS